MFWADKIAKQIIESGEYRPFWLDDMKTPSGRVHVGSLRGVIVHGLIYQTLIDAEAEATFSYVFDDHDPMDALPTYLDKEIWAKYLGKPLFIIPSPDRRAESYGKYYAQEFIEVFNSLGFHPKIFWTSELYKEGKMNDGIRLCLDHVDTIRSIYESQYKKPLSSDWYPFQIVCPNCGKESTTKVNKWDGENVHFTCKADAVDWTVGCGYSGKTSPFSGNGKFVGKLSWKVEWAVKWQVIGVTVEGAGKDHMTAGGSHDIAKRVAEKVLDYPVPFEFSHEFFLIGGKKMSSSKGLGSSAKEVSEMLPPSLLRFLFVRTNYRQAIEFDPVGTMAIPDLFDEYDRCWRAYNESGDEDLSRAFEYAQIGDVSAKRPGLFIPRFRDIANYVQLTTMEVKDHIEKLKGNLLTWDELKILEERKKYVHVWIGAYAPDEYRVQFTHDLPASVHNLSEDQRNFLREITPELEKEDNPDALQLALYNVAKRLSLDSKVAFSAIYQALLGKPHGPRAAWFLLQYPREQVIERLRQASEDVQGETTGSNNHIISKPKLFTIDPEVKKRYPSVSIGIALIRGVTIKKIDERLEKEKKEFLATLEELTTGKLGEYPEIVSYRKLYKEMGIDWHSRRPSPEALLRRVALGKGLYTVNTCVDAYNLVVMKHRVSVGAFDYDTVKFPTVLRFAGEGDEILLLGDKEPMKYTARELAYYDREGGYNIDFNYRDDQRTMVTEHTKKIWINVDGIFEITPEQVEQSLKESAEKIIFYCGGTLEFQGIVV